MFAHVVPFKKLPRHIDYFDYVVPPSLENMVQIGQIVAISFKQQTLRGIVIGFAETTTIPEPKELTGIIQTTPLLAPYQLALATWFSGYYHYSLASTIHLIVPEQPKRAPKVIPQVPIEESDPIPTDTSPSVAIAATHVWAGNEKKFLAQTYSPQQKLLLLSALATRAVNEKKQLVIIVPHVRDCDRMVSSLPASLHKQVVLVNGETTTGITRMAALWDRARHNDAHIFIGTRSALWLPYSALHLLWVDDAHDEDLKNWDQNPRYHAIDVVRKMQELTDCRLVLASPAPRIVDMALAQHKNTPLITLGTPWQPISIVPLTMSRNLPAPFLSEQVVRTMKETLARGERCWLIINKKGYASYLSCGDCQYTPTCATCEFPYTFDSDRLFCFHCRVPGTVPTTCPKCQGNRFVPLGIGIEQIIDSVKNLFPNLHISDEPGADAQVYITSAAREAPRQAATIGLLAFVYIDSLMYFPDFSTHERLVQLCYGVITKLRECRTAPSTILIQTLFPASPAFLALQQPYQAFFQHELEQRNRFGFPPAKTLLKVFFQHHDKNVCTKEATTMYNQLQQLPVSPHWQCSQPYLYYRQQIRGKFRSFLLISYDPAHPDIENTIIGQLPSHWHIDKNPLSVL